MALEPLTTHPKPLRQQYPMTWAAMVVDRARESYGGAWKFLQQAFELSTRDLTLLLAYGSPYWAQLKAIVHKLAENARRQRTFSFMDPQNTEHLLSDLDFCAGPNWKVQKKDVKELLTQIYLKRTL